MNLKEAFRYSTFLADLIDKAGKEIDNRDNTRTVTRIYHMKDIDETLADKTEVLTTPPAVSLDKAISFMLHCIDERVLLSKAIADAKATCGIDIDGAVAANKVRQSAAKSINGMMYYKEKTVKTTANIYRTNVAGDQTKFVVNADEVYTLNYDKALAKKRYAKLMNDADATSAQIDAALVNTTVDFTPSFNVSDTFDDLIETFVG